MAGERTSADNTINAGVINKGGKPGEGDQIDINIRCTEGTEVAPAAPWPFSYAREFFKFSAKLSGCTLTIVGALEVTLNLTIQRPFLMPILDAIVREEPEACDNLFLCEPGPQDQSHAEEPSYVVQKVYRLEGRCDDGTSSNAITAQQATHLMSVCPLQPVTWRELDQRFFDDRDVSGQQVALQLGIPRAWRLRDVRTYALRWPRDDFDPALGSACVAAFDDVIHIHREVGANDRCARPQHFRVLEAEAERPLPHRVAETF